MSPAKNNCVRPGTHSDEILMLFFTVTAVCGLKTAIERNRISPPRVPDRRVFVYFSTCGSKSPSHT